MQLPATVGVPHGAIATSRAATLWATATVAQYVAQVVDLPIGVGCGGCCLPQSETEQSE